MNESVARVFDRILRGLGLKTLNAQFLLSYALMFGLAACASVALYLSMSISPETINVAGAQRMLSQKMAREALQLRLGAGDPRPWPRPSPSTNARPPIWMRAMPSAT